MLSISFCSISFGWKKGLAKVEGIGTIDFMGADFCVMGICLDWPGPAEMLHCIWAAERETPVVTSLGTCNRFLVSNEMRERAKKWGPRSPPHAPTGSTHNSFLKGCLVFV
jgi:hypothetical protein